MDKQQAVAIVIPALNPGPLLLDQLRQLQQGGLTAIVVVDDGSAEAAQPVFTRAHGMGVTVLHHAVNLGKGAALKTGFAHCLRSWPELIGCVTADADGQHTVRDILRMAAALRGCPGALWLGVRNFSAPNVPLRSRWGNCLSAAALRLGGVKVQDSQTGLRAVPAALLPLLMRLPGSRYEYETTMLLAARRAGWPLEELEIEVHFLLFVGIGTEHILARL